MYKVHLVVQYKVKTYITDFIFNMMLKGFHSHLCTIVKHRLVKNGKGGNGWVFNTQVFQYPYQILLIRNYLGETM